MAHHDSESFEQNLLSLTLSLSSVYGLDSGQPRGTLSRLSLPDNRRRMTSATGLHGFFLVVVIVIVLFRSLFHVLLRLPQLVHV